MDGHVRQIQIKQPTTDLTHAWFIAVWTPVFTEFMHGYLMTYQREMRGQTNASQNLRSNIPELHMGDVIQTAIETGLSIKSVIFPEGFCIDIGIPENLIKASKWSNLPSGSSLT